MYIFIILFLISGLLLTYLIFEKMKKDSVERQLKFSEQSEKNKKEPEEVYLNLLDYLGIYYNYGERRPVFRQKL